MIRRLQTILFACLIAVTAWAAGDSVKEYKSVDDVPNVRLTDVRRYVSDPTSILSPAATDTINAILGRLEKSTGIETATASVCASTWRRSWCPLCRIPLRSAPYAGPSRRG